MKKITIILIVILASTILYKTHNDGAEYKIGVTLPLSGNFSMYGESLLNGIHIAVSEYNDTHNNKVTVIAEDNAGETTRALSSFNKFVHLDKVGAVFNSFEYIGLATKDLAEENKIPHILFTTYVLSNKDNPTYTFRDYWGFKTVGNEFGNFLSSKNVSTIKILTQTDASYIDLENAITQKVSIVQKEMFQYGETDFRSYITKLNINKNDSVFVYAFPVEASIIVKQMRELGIKPKYFVLTEGYESPMTSNEQNMRYLSETGAVTYLSSEMHNETSFVQTYKQKFGSVPRADAFYAYEDTLKVISAMTTCGSNSLIEVQRECVKDELRKSFDEFNNIHRDLPLIRFSESGYEVLN